MNDQTTIAELDALPVGTVVIDGEGYACQRVEFDEWLQAGWEQALNSVDIAAHGPITVIYRPKPDDG